MLFHPSATYLLYDGHWCVPAARCFMSGIRPDYSPWPEHGAFTDQWLRRNRLPDRARDLASQPHLLPCLQNSTEKGTWLRPWNIDA